MIEFFVPGKPQGKARARTFTLPNGMVRSCTPGKTVAYEGMIRGCYRVAADGRPEPTYSKGTPVRIRITAYYKPPARTTKRELFQIQNGLKFPLRKPDVDNIIKAVADALNGIAYHDDSQVVEVTANKVFADEEGLQISVSSLAEENILS